MLWFCFFFNRTSIQALAALSWPNQRIISVTQPASKPNEFPPQQAITRYQVFHPSFSLSKHHPLCLPDLLNSLGNTNIVGLKLIQSHADGDGRQVQAPPEDLSQAGVAGLGDVVDDDGLEANMRVQQDGGAQDGVGGGVERAGGEGSNGEGHEAGGEEALKGPVVGAVRGVGVGNGDGVVDCV